MKKCRPPRRKATLALLNAVLIPLLAVPGTASPFQSSSKERALALVQEAIRHIGGETALRSLKSVQFDAIGHTHLIEQSERPEGPWIADYQEKSELVDLENNRFVRTVRHRNFQSPQWSRDLETVVGNGVAAARFGERTAPGSAMEVAEAEERLALSPERVLLTALAASDLHTEGDVALQSVSQHVVVFSWGNGKVRLFLNSASALPTAVEVVRAYPTSVFFHLWGDVSTRTYWTLWTLEAGGVRYPRQWNLERNGVEQQEWTLTSIELNAPVEASRFAIPEETQKAYREGVVQVDDWPLGRPDQPASEIAPGVIQIPGRWNVALIRQTDGVVVLEGPISSGYSARVLEEAERRFPGVPIKAVITTSDAWPHFGGMREYAALHVPIYAVDLNKPILERLFAAPYRSYPDRLERLPTKERRLNFHLVSGKTVVGTGPNRVEIYPIRGESSERMMMVYFPEHELLYGSDLAQQMRNGDFFMPEYLLELSEAVQREKLRVRSVFAMHTRVVPWPNVQSAIERAKRVEED